MLAVIKRVVDNNFLLFAFQQHSSCMQGRRKVFKSEEARRSEVFGEGQLAPSPSAREYGERCKLPHAVRSGAKPRPKSVFVFLVPQKADNLKAGYCDF